MYIINVTVGATTMRRVLKISLSKVCSLEPAPLISRKPMMIIAIPMPNKIKFILSNAKFFLSIIFNV